jgi:hypothetical protein
VTPDAPLERLQSDSEAPNGGELVRIAVEEHEPRVRGDTVVGDGAPNVVSGAGDEGRPRAFSGSTGDCPSVGRVGGDEE